MAHFLKSHVAHDTELSQIQELGDRRSQLSMQKLNKRQLIKRQVHDSPRDSNLMIY